MGIAPRTLIYTYIDLPVSVAIHVLCPCPEPLIDRDRMLQAMPNVALALHLLNERYNPKSFWKPYIGEPLFSSRYMYMYTVICYT